MVDAWHASQGNGTEDAFAAALAQLTKGSFSDRARVIDELARLGDARVADVFDAFLQGSLYYDKSTRAVLIVTKSATGYLGNEVLAGKEPGLVTKKDIKKISVNNALRSSCAAGLRCSS